MLFYIAVFLFALFLSSISQVMLKKAALRTYPTKVQEYLNPLVIFAYILFFSTTFMSVYAYKGIPLSMGSVLEATSYIYVTIFGVTIFQEKIGSRKLLALALILSGILVYSLLG